MRSLSLLFPLLLAIGLRAQHLTFNEWRDKAMQDIRLLPRYGDQEKSQAQKDSDEEFRIQMRTASADARDGSQQLIARGFDLLHGGDMTKAMYRFNQAFLIDPANSDIYWGYGSFFMELDNPGMAHTMFRAGLSVDSTNTHLLTEEATAYLAERHALITTDDEAATKAVDQALAMLQRSYRHDPKDPNTLFKMAICHLHRNECAEAWEFWEQAIAVRERGPTDPTLVTLNARCPR